MKTPSKTKKLNVAKSQKIIKKRRRVKIGAVLVFLIILVLLLSLFFGILSKPITNIYISGNNYLSDQEVIELGALDNYPSAIKNLSLLIKKRLEKSDLIISAKVKKKGFTRVYIEIEENRPLVFNSSINQTILLDGTTINEKMPSSTLVNYVPDTIYDSFINAIKGIENNVLERVSEILYNPNDVDAERFLLIMDDGNYVYLTLRKFDSINNYINIIKKFGDKKGILYLDSGEYFKVLDN
ncbi:MAG: FtsQ-type POTRA domain-containing protein [Firmicutes bacterium]|nr:FtsQ-type POTRA domain-containing protein [Bacillota bacterium]